MGRGSSGGLGGTVHQGGPGLEAAAVEASLGESTLEGALAEGTQLEDLAAHQFRCEGSNGESGILAAQFQERLRRGGVQGAVLTTVATGLVAQCGELAMLEPVEPVLQGLG